MRRIQIQTKQIDPEDYLGKYANVDDVSTIVDEDCVVEVDGKVVLAYIQNMGGPLEHLRAALDSHKFGGGARATNRNAMITTASVFGYQPRMEFRTATRFCRVAATARQNKPFHDLLMAWTASITRVYLELAPDAAKSHKAETDKRISKEYQIPQSMFTSGIVNKSNQLPYHYDSGNFIGAWSGMLGLSKNINGGVLSIPEYDLGIPITDGSLSFFDGQARIHGVTPFKRTSVDAERYTIVWYSLRKLWECLPFKEEIKLANERVTKGNRKKKVKKT